MRYELGLCQKNRAKKVRNPVPMARDEVCGEIIVSTHSGGAADSRSVLESGPETETYRRSAGGCRARAFSTSRLNSRSFHSGCKSVSFGIRSKRSKPRRNDFASKRRASARD